MAEVGQVQFPHPLAAVEHHDGVLQVKPPVQFHSLLKIMDTNRQVSSKEGVRLKLLLSLLSPGLQLFYFIWISSMFLR